MPKKSLLLSAIFFDCLGKAAVFCVHKLKEKVRDPLPTVWRNRLRGRSPLSLRDISPAQRGNLPTPLRKLLKKLEQNFYVLLTFGCCYCWP